jgi:bifunctional DNA-binding transcriptional regulator/antitoxin component of YhaV-PrlF toxin-antitoxin module
MKASVTVDQVGRLVLPKNIREAIGVFGRMAVQVEVVGHAARITAAEPTGGAVARKRGRLVCAEPLPEHWDSGEAVLHMRERRLRR